MENINKAVNGHEEEVGKNYSVNNRGMLIQKLDELQEDSLIAETVERRAELAKQMEEISKKLAEMGGERTAA